MKKILVLIAALLLTTLGWCGTQDCGDKAATFPFCNNIQSTATSGTAIIVNEYVGGVRATFNYVFTGSPSSGSVVLQGCIGGSNGTCETLDTYSATSSTNRSPTITKPFDTYVITPTWSGGTNVTFTVRTRATIAGNASGGGAGAANYATTFSSATSVSVSGATHGLGSKNLIVEAYDTGTNPSTRIALTSLTVDPSSFDVVASWSGSKSGYVVINGTGTGPQGSAGANGTNGTNGCSLLNGSGAPSGGTGSNCDFFIDTLNNRLYGPKASGSWPGGYVSLVGPAGATGATGSAGSNGTNGTNGTNGCSVLNGSGTPSSGTGANCDFYIDTAAHCLYGPKSAGAWPGSCIDLVGPAGTGTGDVLGQSSSVDGEVALFSGTGGKQLKRAVTTGLAKLTSGILSAATPGTDYMSIGADFTFGNYVADFSGALVTRLKAAAGCTTGSNGSRCFDPTAGNWHSYNGADSIDLLIPASIIASISDNDPLALAVSSGKYTVKKWTGSSMVYPGAGIPQSTGTAWGTSLSFDTNTSLGTSNTTVPSQNAVKSYVDAHSGLSNPMSAIGDMLGGGTSGAPARIAAGKTGQVPTATNGATPAFASPGIADGNGGSPVTTTPYSIQCDSSTAIIDRARVIPLASGASVVNVPDHTTSGCDGNMMFSLVNDGAGTVTINRGGTDTFNIVDGSTSSDSQTSFTLTNGQHATMHNGRSGIWTVRKYVNSSLSTPVSVANGGTGTGSTLTGLVRGGSPMTASELSGDCTTSGSNAVTCLPLVVKTTTTPVSVNSTISAAFYYNQHATAGQAVTYNLPAAVAGMQRCISNSYNGSAANTGIVTLATSGSGQFIEFTDGTLSTSGGNVASTGSAGDAACVVGIDSTHWKLYVQSGNWVKN